MNQSLSDIKNHSKLTEQPFRRSLDPRIAVAASETFDLSYEDTFLHLAGAPTRPEYRLGTHQSGKVLRPMLISMAPVRPLHARILVV